MDLRHAVIRVDGSANGRQVQVTVITPWTEHKSMALAALAGCREQDPAHVYGLLSLPTAGKTLRPKVNR